MMAEKDVTRIQSCPLLGTFQTVFLFHVGW
jgi:hypothetical protein